VTRYEPKDPGWDARVRAVFAAQGLMGALGVTIAELTPGRCVLRLPYGPAVTQHHGFFHGGAIGTIADVAGGCAGSTLLPPGQEILTCEYKVNFVSPARGEAVVATGTVVKGGRRVIVTRIDVHAERAGHRHLCAIAQQTLMPMEGESPT